MPQDESAAHEQTPLLQPPPSTVDAGSESLDSDITTKDEGKPTISKARGTLCIIALGCLIFLQATNISLLTVAQSSVAADLDAFEQTSWFTSAYLIAMSSTSPINGKLSQIFTPRISIFISTIILSAGVLVTAFANDFTAFIIGRAITGVGAAGIFTVSIIIVIELSSAKTRGLFMGLLNSGYTVGVAAGATIAGAMLPATGWRALFWLQAPISTLAGIVLFVSMPHTFALGKQDKRSILSQLGRLDYFGAATLTASIILILYALSSPTGIPILPIILSIIVLATFLLNETYLAADPIIPIPLLKSRALLFTCLATVGYMMARWTVLFYTPTYAIAVRAWTPATAGSILIPTNGGFALGGLAAGYFHIRRHGSFYVPSLVVYAIFPITLVALAFIASTPSSPALLVLVVFTNGAVTGAALNYTLAHLLHCTPSSTHYIATSLIATFRGFAGSFGSAIGGGLFSRALGESLRTGFAENGIKNTEGLVRRLLGSPTLVAGLEGVERDVAVKGYQDGLKALWIGAAGLAALMVFVQAGTGWKGAAEEKVIETEAEVVENRRRDSEE